MASKNTKKKALELINIEAEAYRKDKKREHLEKIQEIVNAVHRSLVLQFKKEGETPYHITFIPGKSLQEKKDGDTIEKT